VLRARGCRLFWGCWVEGIVGGGWVVGNHCMARKEGTSDWSEHREEEEAGQRMGSCGEGIPGPTGREP
jgi:hypothetical protein